MGCEYAQIFSLFFVLLSSGDGDGKPRKKITREKKPAFKIFVAIV